MTTTPTDIASFVSDLLARNKALHGDLRMEATSEEPEGEKPEGDKPAGDEPPPEGEKPEGEKPEGEQKPSPEDELPDWARTELKKVRGEAAGYRTKLRDAEAKLTSAKTPEEVEAAITEFKATNERLERELAVATVARKFELPDELAARLQGSTPEELEADAKALQKFVTPSAPGDLKGGLDPSDDEDGETDPRKLARRVRR